MSRAIAPSFADLEDAWARAAERWLPHESPDSIWRFGRGDGRVLPGQGWKVHVSATILTAREVLEVAAPLLERRGVPFKAAKSLLELKRLNCGLFYGYGQIGKFMTAYPYDGEAGVIAAELDAATRGMAAPAVPFETPISPGSAVYFRYGSFGGDPSGAPSDSVVDPEGRLVPDRRDRNPDWAVPPPGLRLQRTEAGGSTPLSSRYRAYSALMQRGKGGVYRALDLGTTPPRPCVLKEGRSSGEVDWDGSSGLSRVRREAEVLGELAASVVDAPAIYDYFEQDGNGYLVLEWIGGTRVADVVDRAAPLLEIPAALALARDCAAVTAQVHEQGWVWRDLKPQNLVLDSGRLRPLDFEGAARVGGDHGPPWGTAGYVPPEWADQTVASFQQDCFALGVLIHQVLTNSEVGPSTEQPAPASAIRSEVPEEVDALVSALTHPDPSRRPAAAAAERHLAALAH